MLLKNEVLSTVTVVISSSIKYLISSGQCKKVLLTPFYRRCKEIKGNLMSHVSEILNMFTN